MKLARVSLSTRVIKRVSPFHANHKARVFRECENKNMKFFSNLASVAEEVEQLLPKHYGTFACALPIGFIHALTSAK